MKFCCAYAQKRWLTDAVHCFYFADYVFLINTNFRHLCYPFALTIFILVYNIENKNQYFYLIMNENENVFKHFS